jgi:trk system potassium uptake protein TrkA
MMAPDSQEVAMPPSTRQQYAVIGLGTFGLSVCRALRGMGHEVLGIDPDEDVVREAYDAQVATQVVQADPLRAASLAALDLASFEAVVVARGSNLELSILTVMNALEVGAKLVVAKAAGARHAEMLERLGGGRVRVVIPEQEMGERVALQLVAPDIVKAILDDPKTAIAEVPLPEALAGRTLAEGAIRSRLGVLVIAVQRGGTLMIAPEATLRLAAGDRLVVIGPNARVEALGR